MNLHPDQALFQGEQSFPDISACEHFAGNEKLILKALTLQKEMGPIFDISCDCEDGAAAGQELQHMQMIVDILNSDANKFGKAGVRIHDHSHPVWRKELDILIKGAGQTVAYITIPKPSSAQQVMEMITYMQSNLTENNIQRKIPVHVLIETHGALNEVFAIAALPWVQVLDFGLMDFISSHHGAISSAAMRSPGQFEHPLLARAKSTIAAAAFANGLVPSHNVTIDLKDAYTTFQDAWRARHQFGFLRMWSIHPNQIEPILEAMKPNFEEVQHAADILVYADQKQWGPIRYEGELYDRASYRYYWQLLKRAKTIDMPIPESARYFFKQ